MMLPTTLPVRAEARMRRCRCSSPLYCRARIGGIQLGDDALLHLWVSHARDALRERKTRQTFVGWARRERMKAGIEAEHHTDRARRDLARHRDALLVRLGDLLHQIAPLVRSRGILQDGKRHGAPGRYGHTPENVELRFELEEVGDALQHALAIQIFKSDYAHIIRCDETINLPSKHPRIQ